MKLRSAVLVVLALALASPAAAQQMDWKGHMRKVLDAWETLDVTKPAPFYAKEPTRTFFDIAPMKYTGWSAYAAGVQKVFVDTVQSAKFTLNDDVQVQQSGKSAWGTATFKIDMVSKAGTRESAEGRWTVVFEKVGKDWLIVHEHVSFPAPEPPSGPQSLYKRVGGYDAIAAVVDDFLGRLAGDAQLKRFFVGTSADSLKRIRQLVVEQICSAAGGPCIYIGRTMRASHDGLNITEADWNSAVKHLVATLDKFKVPEKEKGELIGAVASLKPDIVIAPKR
jgi:hemoglobin